MNNVNSEKPTAEYDTVNRDTVNNVNSEKPTTEYDTVTLKCNIEGTVSNVLVDSGACSSVIDVETLKGFGSFPISKTDKSLVDASGNSMQVIGTVSLSIQPLGVRKATVIKFCVIEASRYRCILLGRNFMGSYKSVTFDFEKNRIKLGESWCRGVTTKNNDAVRLVERTVIPARSEKVVKVKCHPRNSLISADFEPKRNPMIESVYVNRARVAPNSDGCFWITILNTSTTDQSFASRSVIGAIYPKSTAVTHVPVEVEPKEISESLTFGPSLSKNQQSNLKCLIDEYSDIFTTNSMKPKRTNVLQHTIVTDDALPQYRKPYKIPHAYENEVDKQIKEMIENDIIRPSVSPWNAPVMLVKKKDQSLRFVLDFRALNDVTKKDTYPLPLIQDLIDRMGGSVYWTKLDAASAYWSMPLEEESKEKTAFSVHRGKFEFNVTPYGLCNAGRSYQRMIDITLSGLPSDRVLAYMDDISIFTATFDDHMLALRSVFERLREAGITLKLGKCEFACDNIDFLGYNVSQEGIKPQKGLTDSIIDFATPSNRKELKRFLGMVSFYRNFIRNFSEISNPLNKLTSDKVSFDWDSNCENSFSTMKNCLVSAPILAFPRISEPFIVEVDASDNAVGGELSQYDTNGEAHPVAYFSSTLSKSQRNWSPHSKEAYALIVAVRNWNVYLAGTEFILRSDHNPLVHLRKMKNPKGKFARWISELEEYRYTVEYIPGKQNVKADALSRNENAIDSPLSDTEFEDKIYSVEILVDDNFENQLKNEQLKDPVMCEVRKEVENGNKITEGKFKRINKQLRIENGLLTKSGRPIIPPSLRKFVTESFHDIAHFGAEKIYDLIKRRFYWPNMFKYVQIFTSSCQPCQQTKADSRPPKAPLVPMHEPEYPMQFISMDIQYMPVDDNGFRYVLLIGDLFSKYVETVPLQEQSAPKILSALLEKWILHHGCPTYLLSDQASNMDGAVIREICNAFGIEKRRSSAYHSQGNGFAERNIRNVRETIRTTLLARNLSQKSWVSILNSLTFALNTTISKAIKCSPYEVVYGRPATLPIDVKMGTSKQLNGEFSTAKDYAKEISCSLQEVYNQVQRNLQINREKMSAQYNRNLHVIDFQPGQKVWLKMKYFKTGESKKLAPRKSGPWTIEEKLGNGVNFKIKRDSTKKEMVVHHDRLIPIRNLPIPASTPVYELSGTDSDDESDDDVTHQDEPDDDVNHQQINSPRYPRRNRVQRQIEGAIPWDAIDDLPFIDEGGE